METILGFIPLLKEVIGLFPSEAKRVEMTLQLQNLEVELAKAQLQVNANEASNPNLFVAGWRPFIGWTCGVGLIYSVMGPAFGGPPVDLTALMTILMGMLGLGGMRTFEKVKGVSGRG